MNSDSEVDLIITEHDLDNLDPQLADGNNSTLTTNFNKRSSSTSQSNPAKRPKHSTISNTFKTTTTTANTSDISVTSSSSNDFLLHHSHPHGHPVPAAGGGGGATGEGGDSDYDAEQDADHSDEDGSSSSSSDDDDSFVDPLLKDSKRSKHHHHSKSSSKPFRTTTSTSNGSELPLPSLDYTHISQALAHQPLATNPSQQTISLMQKLGLAATNAITIGGEEGLKGFMNEVKNQMFSLSQRLDLLETSRFSQVASISALQLSQSSLESKLLPSSSSSHQNPVSEAVNAQSAGEMAVIVQQQIHEAMAASGASDVGGSGGGAGAGPADFLGNGFGGFGFENIGNGGVTTGKKRGRKAGSGGGKKREEEGGGGEGGDNDLIVASSLPRLPSLGPGGGTDQKPTKRARKPELSRVVRATMFRLLGLSIGTSSTKYHGYTSSPILPDFNPTVSFDQLTGQRIWRWEWDKTIRQSQFNSSFSTAIINQINLDREQSGLYRDVPENDWASLEEAIESAYTNLRRERETQVDPVKKAKKDEHRKKGKKRGLKEDKVKRRQKAFLEGGTMSGNGFNNSSGSGGDEGWIGLLNTFSTDNDGATGSSSGVEGGSGDNLKDALELKYMSSEDELESTSLEAQSLPELTFPNQTTIVVGVTEKVIKISRPSWRSEKLKKVFGELDLIKPPERSFKRVLGEERKVIPPLGTPDWMINDEWKQKIIDQQALEGVARAALGDTTTPSSPSKGKGKGKA